MEPGAEHVYEVTGPSRWLMPVVLVGTLVLGVAALFVVPLISVVLLIAVAFTYRQHRRAVRRVETDDRGLRLVAPARTVEVAWSDLRSVGFGRGAARSLLVWTWAGGSAPMPADLAGLDHLVALVRARCPSAAVDPALP